MRFTRIVDPLVYGYECTIGNRRAEVIRAYEGQWLCFRYEDNQMLCDRLAKKTAERMLGIVNHKSTPDYISETEARRIARAFLRREDEKETRIGDSRTETDSGSYDS